jgi:tetratricopeptide (TPR) repeat protein
MLKQFTLAIAVSLMLAVPAQAQTSQELQTMQTFLDIMTSYFEIIEATHDVNSHEEKAAIMQMQKIQEIYEQRGEKVRSVEVLRAVLKDSRNPTIRNAAYMLMGDTLKEAGRADEALELLQQGLRENIAAADSR